MVLTQVWRYVGAMAVMIAMMIGCGTAAASNTQQMEATATGWWQDANPSLAVDGDWRTTYVGTGDNNAIEVAFAEARQIESITIGFHTQSHHRPRAYRIELQKPDGRWTTVANMKQLPEDVAAHELEAPATATGVRITATQLSTSNNMSIRQIVFNSRLWTSTTSLDLPRPTLVHNPAVRVQPFDARLKFYHHGDGLLFYSQGDYNRLDAMLVVSPLAADAKWFTSSYGMGRHRFSGPFVVDDSQVAVEVTGSAGRHRLAVEQLPDAVKVRDTFQFNRESSADVEAVGLVFRLPVDFWAGGQWRVGSHTGELAPVAKATGELATFDDIVVLPVVDVEGMVTVELRPSSGRGTLTLQIASEQLAELRYVRRSGFSGHFIDLYAIRRNPNGRAQDDQLASYDWRWRVRFDEALARPWWESFGHDSHESVRQLLNTDATVVANRAGGSSGREGEQILDPDSPFHGAVADTGGDRNGLIEAMPLHTRNHVIQLARRFRQTGDDKDLPAIMAGLDYLAATVAPWGQFGDIRVGGWVEAPFFWDIVGVAEAIEVVRSHSDDDRVSFWLAGVHRQYQAVVTGTQHRLRFKDDIGPNMVTFAVQLFRMARYFQEDTGGDLAYDAMSFALAMDPSPYGGLQQDYSYTQGNQFDTGYYRWLLNLSFDWHALTKGTAWELKGEDRDRWEQMQEAFLWLYDNGQLNTMTAHPKNRLHEGDVRPMRPYGNEALWGPAKQRADYLHAHGPEALPEFVADDQNLPLGSRHFDIAGMFVQRTSNRYISFWWNERSRARDDAAGANANYNAKTPLGAYYLRNRQAPRELTIPSDNIHYSGALLAEGMDNLEDWATGFENYVGSRLSQPIDIGEATLFVADVICRSKRLADAPTHMMMTTLIAPSEVVRAVSAPAQPNATPITLQPLVIRAKNDREPALASIEWESLFGELPYDWSLSEQPIDGSQQYASLPAANVWRLRAHWPATEPLATAWRIAHQPTTAWAVEAVTPTVHHLYALGGTRIIVVKEAVQVDRQIEGYPDAHIVVGEQPTTIDGRNIEQVGHFWHIQPTVSQ
ncbi:discoidin domain-containing protein [Phycisphaerales bacterium AB-hyl4]|uniref:Discoidin domain-containing protein n=1 Tax=Natronomicrosphaera hydrolytica TaxID=3242702 RepID=A0ABV4U199_9BACT